MPEVITPESRVFRIANECYIVYLGNELGDVRPFLRIGNTPYLTTEINKAVSTTVITDNHVGNPLLEILNVAKHHNRYLGDTDVVDTMRRFFESFDLPTNELTDYRKVKDGEKRHMVWFYASGNINLRYDNRVVFDLNKREKQDKHFIQLFEEAKIEYYRNPFRYIKQDFSDRGIVLTGGNAFWYESEEFLSIAAHEKFMSELLCRGIDPDLISAFMSNLTYAEVESPDASAYVRLLKRLRHRRNTLRVFTESPELQHKIKHLFPVRRSTPSTIDVIDVSERKKGIFQSSVISRRGKGWLIHHAGIPDVLFDGAIDEGLAIDSARGIIRYRTEKGDNAFSVPDGYPVRFVDRSASDVQLIDKYTGHVSTCIKDTLLPEEAEAVLALGRYLQVFQKVILDGKTDVSPASQQSATLNAGNILRKNGFSMSGMSWFYFSNVLAILTMIGRTVAPSHPLVKDSSGLIAILGSMLKKNPHPDAAYPFFADLYLGEAPILLWRAVKRSSSARDSVAAQKINEKIRHIMNPDEAPWIEDKARLLKLIRGLRGSGDASLSQQQLSLLYNVEEAPSRPEPRRNSPPPTEYGGTARKPMTAKKSAIKTATPVGSVVPPKTRQHQDNRQANPQWLLLLLPLLIAGVAIWDFTGNAPWGQILKNKKSPPIAIDIAETVFPEVTGDGEQGSEASYMERARAAARDASTEVGTGDGEQESEASYMERAKVAEAASTEVGTGDEIIDVNKRPKTIEEVDSYLDINGRITISEADIHLTANEIAVLNGYKDLDYMVYSGEDPDWIYPNQTLLLPDSGNFTIHRGDTIWYLAVREIRLDAERGLREYDQAVAILDNSESSTEKRIIDAAETLRNIARTSRVAVLREMAQKVLELQKM